MNIVVLAGGTSTERDISILTSTKVCESLRRNGYNANIVDVFFGIDSENVDNFFNNDNDLEKLCDYIAFLHKGKLLLCEEKDLLQEEYGLVHCSIDEFQAIPFNSVKYKKENAYGVEAMVLRNAVPSDIHISPISIEELFVFMVKEAK